MANVLNADGTADPKTRHVIMLAKIAKSRAKEIGRWIGTIYSLVLIMQVRAQG